MLYLIRHGETDYNIQRRLQGSADLPLSGSGIEQARKVGRALRDLVGDAAGWTLDSSPLRRARATAEIIRQELNTSAIVRVDDRLREVSLGSWEGMTDVEIDAQWPEAGIRDSVRRAWAYHCPDGEKLGSVQARVTDWLKDAGATNRIVVSHGIVGSVLRGVFAGLTEEQFLRLPVGHRMFFGLQGGAISAFSV